MVGVVLRALEGHSHFRQRASPQLLTGHPGRHRTPKTAFGVLGELVQLVRSSGVKVVAEDQQDGGDQKRRRQHGGKSHSH
jgi:hypothetical protein